MPHALLRRLPATLAIAGGASASVAPTRLPAQTAASFDWSIAEIMRGPEHFGREPANVAFTHDGQWIYFSWLPAGSPWQAPLRPYRVRPATNATPEAVSDAHMDSVSVRLASGPRTRDGRLMAVAARGDLYLVTLRTGALRRLTETAATEGDPRFSADEQQLLFTRDNNAYAFDLASGAVRQLTDVRSGPAPRDSARATGMRGALERQQRELFAVVRDDRHTDSVAKAQRTAALARGLPLTYLPAGERLATLSVSPSLRTAVLLTASTPPGQPRIAQVPTYVTASGFTEEIPTRTKVGDGTVRFRAYRLVLATGMLQPLWVIGGDSTRAASQVRMMGWADDGSAALMVGFTPDFKWRYLTTVGDSGGVRIVEALNDTAWVGGPCGSCMGWLPNGRVWYASEASGYAHLYSANRDGDDRMVLTSGSWEVERAELLPGRREFLLHTSEASPFVRHAYRMAVTGGPRTQLTREHGGHSVTMSPDGARFADVYSASNLPPELHVATATRGDLARLTTSTSEAFRARAWLKPRIVRIPASDGVPVPARIYTPQEFGVQPNGAAVMFVHGAGYLHNVHDYWSSYSREYAFNQFLASKGYVVLDVDYRASAGYGRDWRTAIYRWMGGRDLQDHVDASRYLNAQFGIAPERVGIYGGSYGGFMTLMALFTAPQHFGAGAALRSVTDWAHYNHGYTGSILNLPQDDTLAYRRSSPIYFAEGLEDPLLMAHGMVDTNVHFQDIVRLSQRLIELGKTGWELAVYPVEDHGFVRPDSWTDEYRRIYELFERTIGPNGSKARR